MFYPPPSHSCRPPAEAVRAANRQGPDPNTGASLSHYQRLSAPTGTPPPWDLCISASLFWIIITSPSKICIKLLHTHCSGHPIYSAVLAYMYFSFYPFAVPWHDFILSLCILRDSIQDTQNLVGLQSGPSLCLTRAIILDLHSRTDWIPASSKYILIYLWSEVIS